MKKAYTARTFRTPSGEFANGVKGNSECRCAVAHQYHGGAGRAADQDRRRDIGAVGVSGAPGGEKDEACAKAGIDKVAGPS